MDSFSRRSGLRSEFSGPDEVSSALRDRLLEVAERYISRGPRGIGSEGWYVDGDNLDHRIAVEFGRRGARFEDVLLQGDYHDVLTAVEFYMAEAREAYRRVDEITAGFKAAFALSGSVYYLDRDGRVAMRMEPDATARVAEASKVLTPFAKAKAVFDAAVAGLLSRREEPKNVVRDVALAFEEYLKSISGEGDFGAATNALRRRGVLTATQAGIMDKLNGFKSETFGPSHPGPARTPTEGDAVWFVETVSAQLKFLANAVRTRVRPEGLRAN